MRIITLSARNHEKSMKIIMFCKNMNKCFVEGYSCQKLMINVHVIHVIMFAILYKNKCMYEIYIICILSCLIASQGKITQVESMGHIIYAIQIRSFLFFLNL